MKKLWILGFILFFSSIITAQVTVRTVVVTPATAEAEVGKPIKFTAVGKDEAGNTLSDKPTAWFAAPFDLAHAGEDGTVAFFQPGEVMVGAIVGGKAGFAKVMVKAPGRFAHRYRSVKARDPYRRNLQTRGCCPFGERRSA